MIDQERDFYLNYCDMQIDLLDDTIALTRDLVARRFYEGKREAFEQMRRFLTQPTETIEIKCPDGHVETTVRLKGTT
jgi:hypothetical protein